MSVNTLSDLKVVPFCHYLVLVDPVNRAFSIASGIADDAVPPPPPGFISQMMKVSPHPNGGDMHMGNFDMLASFLSRALGFGDDINLVFDFDNLLAMGTGVPGQWMVLGHYCRNTGGAV